MSEDIHRSSKVDGTCKNSISSILDKMQRKKINVNDVEKELEDIAGIRLICQFVEDLIVY